MFKRCEMFKAKKKRPKPLNVVRRNSGRYPCCENCTYYYGEIDQCMFGEADVPDNLERKCEVKENENRMG